MQIVRDVIAGCESWERMETLDDSLDFRTREFAFDGGALTIGAAFAFGRLASMCVTLDNLWTVDYAFDPDIFVRVQELVPRVRRVPFDPEFWCVPAPYCTRFRTLHPYIRQLGAMAHALPITS